MIVKIEKSTEPFFWYSSKIGELMDVQSWNENWYKVKKGPNSQMNILKSDVSKVDERGVPHSLNETIRVQPNFHPKKKSNKNTNGGMMILLFIIFLTQLAIVGTGVFYALTENERDNKDERIRELYMKNLYYERVNHHLFNKCKECDVSDYWNHGITFGKPNE